MTKAARQVPPTKLHDDEGAIAALRIDGPKDTRGKARAFFAREWGLDFTDVRLRRSAFRVNAEASAEERADGIPSPYDGWPSVECSPTDPGARPYWVLAEECRCA